MTRESDRRCGHCELRHRRGCGTGSARAGLFDLAGRMLGIGQARHHAVPREPGSIVEQSSAESGAPSAQCREAGDVAGSVSPDQVAGIGFDATCSLVVLGEGGQPLPVGPSERTRSATSSSGWTTARSSRRSASTPAATTVLDYVGGTISPEMETPKLLWLKENRPRSFDGGLAVLRPGRLPDLAGDRQPCPLAPARSPANGPISPMSGAGTKAIFAPSASACWRTKGLHGSAPRSSTRHAARRRPDREAARRARPCGRERRSPRA